MAKSFFPKSIDFFEKFAKVANIASESGKVFLELVNKPSQAQAYASKLVELEAQADKVVHSGLDGLHEAFTTPIERNDVHKLFIDLDNIVDQLEASGQRIALYELKDFPQEMVKLAELSSEAATRTEALILSLEQIKNPAPIRKICQEVISLEEQADKVFRIGLGKLFKEENDIKRLIQLKELYDFVESVTDACEDVAQTVEAILLDYS